MCYLDRMGNDIEKMKNALLVGPLGFANRNQNITEKLGHVKRLLTAERGFVTEVAKAIQWSPTELQQYIAEHPDLKDFLLSCRRDLTEILLDLAENNLLKALENGQHWATQFVLTHKGAERGYLPPDKIKEKIIEQMAQEVANVVAEEINDPAAVNRVLAKIASKAS